MPNLLVGLAGAAVALNADGAVGSALSYVYVFV